MSFTGTDNAWAFAFYGVGSFIVAAIMGDKREYLESSVTRVTEVPLESCQVVLESQSLQGTKVRLVGTLAPVKEPLKSTFGNTECVYRYYKKSEAHREDYHADRAAVHRLLGSDEERSEERFFLDDGTGRILIEPLGAEIDGVVTMDMLQDIGMDASLTGFKAHEAGGKSISLAQRYEMVLPVGTQATVVGVVHHGSDGLFIGCDLKQDDPMIITVKSDDELKSQVRRGISMWWFMNWVFFLLGSVLFILALLALIL